MSRSKNPVRVADIREGQTRRFCYEVLPRVAPRYVLHQAVAGAEVAQCFRAVEMQVRIYGGEQVVGWALWVWPKVMIEAEWHAVWRDPEGVLMDITPRPPGMRLGKIAFLLDADGRGKGEARGNIRKNLAGGGRRALVDRYIAQAERAEVALHRADDPEQDAVCREEQHKLLELQDALRPGHVPGGAH
ncbi:MULTISPECIES: hypothetical protein [Halomonas]|uniref:hypothetical protein n=1 Tax=Halomonas TaxID=2745 RepID=UPI001C94AA82|nr:MULTISPECIES: hypothetical protein [Halomonas]MBY6206907.1 hypothetical protein [Halomonas sp. DP3Y7-2]MBY6230381.1 hypothetical protein [Halomonas sp. DP3Y7-1]MCA0918541.1 hypothetical protein [Halomonas denitrificans]